MASPSDSLLQTVTSVEPPPGPHSGTTTNHTNRHTHTHTIGMYKCMCVRFLLAGCQGLARKRRVTCSKQTAVSLACIQQMSIFAFSEHEDSNGGKRCHCQVLQNAYMEEEDAYNFICHVNNSFNKSGECSTSSWSPDQLIIRHVSDSLL